MNGFPAIARTLLPLLLAGALAACNGSVGTTTNANLNQQQGGYSGPAAKTEDIRSFQLNFWEFLSKDNRCGQCHGVGQAPAFVDLSDVNKAYSQAIRYADLQDPASSAFVSKVGGGHQCWLSSLSACASTIEQMISNWATDSNVTSARLITLTAPTLRDPGDAKSFPPDANSVSPLNGTSFASTVYPWRVNITLKPNSAARFSHRCRLLSQRPIHSLDPKADRIISPLRPLAPLPR